MNLANKLEKKLETQEKRQRKILRVVDFFSLSSNSKQKEFLS